VIVAFDTWVLKSSHRNSGIYNYAKNILKAFRAPAALGDDVTMRLFFTPRYSDGAVDFSSSPGMEIIPTRLLQLHRLWQLGGVTAAAARSHADLIFSPTTHTCPLGPIPVITTIHDVTPVLSPSFSSLPNLLERIRIRNAAKFSVKCITDSQCSKKDLVETYGLAADKVAVVHLGYDQEIFNDLPADSAKQKSLMARHGIRQPYIFHHSVLQPRKNLVRLIQACSALWSQRRLQDFPLVLAGPLGWNYEPILEAANKSGFADQIIFTQALPDEDLATLLKGASLCVIPSLYEGFCLPMVEAMACGTPTIAAAASCLPEISGGVLRYFDPLSIEGIADAIATALEDSALRRQLSEAGITRASDFSWTRCAAETLAVLASSQQQRIGHNGHNGNGRRSLAFR
jgi:glycosyltransferase involved in cell wall biosynthesis